MEKIIKIALVCHVSNEFIRSNLTLRPSIFKFFLNFIRGKKVEYQDYSIWNTLLLEEFESIDEIEMHAIIPHPDVIKGKQHFINNGVHYHCFKQDMESFSNIIKRKKKNIFSRYKNNTKRIIEIVDEIHPDLFVMIGADGPFYGLSGLEINTRKIPLVLVLQTALSDPDFLKNYNIDKQSYRDRCDCEQALFKYANYIATDVEWYRHIVKQFNSEAVFVRHYFCTPIYNIDSIGQKEYDFVYWAANIMKAGEDAIMAFAEACHKDCSLTLNIVGDCSDEFRHFLELRLQELGVLNNVHFSGYMPTHNAALKEVSKAKYALIPIKVDIVSGTIREAMMLGLPVVTYETHGTPHLNDEYEIVLLSKIGDYRGLAANMLRLCSDKDLVMKLRQNGFRYCRENLDNKKGVKLIAEIYMEIYNNFYKGEPISEELTKSVL